MPLFRHPSIAHGPEIGFPIASMPRGDERNDGCRDAQTSTDPHSIHERSPLSSSTPVGPSTARISPRARRSIVRIPPLGSRPIRPGRGWRARWSGWILPGTTPAGGGAVQPRPAEGRLSSQPPRGSRAVYASWTTSFLPCAYPATEPAGWQQGGGNRRRLDPAVSLSGKEPLHFDGPDEAGQGE